MHKCGSLICITFSVNLTLSFLVIVMFVVTSGSHNFYVRTSNLYPRELYKWDLCVFDVSGNYLCRMSARLIIQMKCLKVR